MAKKEAIPERITWAVDLMAPGPDERLLEIGPGPGVAVGVISDRLKGGRITAIDRSSTAIARAQRRNAHHVASGTTVLGTIALEDLQPADVLEPGQLFDKVFAMNVNLFWVRSAVKELALIKGLLKPDGSLHLFYGYGEDSPRVPSVLTEHLTDAGFDVEVQRGPSAVAVVARVAGDR